MTQLFMVQPVLPAATPAPLGADPIRPAVAADAASLAVLLSAAYQEPWDVDRVHRVLLDAPDVSNTYLIEEDGAVVATASARYLAEYPGAGYLHYVAADATRPGRGLGRALTVAVLEEFARAGLTRAVLETDDFRLPAVVTYLRLGFVPEYRNDAERVAWSGLMQVLFQKKESK